MYQYQQFYNKRHICFFNADQCLLGESTAINTTQRTPVILALQ